MYLSKKSKNQIDLIILIYTEIDQESKMKQMRKDMIEKCTKTITNLIQKWKAKRKSKLDECKELRNMMFIETHKE